MSCKIGTKILARNTSNFLNLVHWMHNLEVLLLLIETWGSIEAWWTSNYVHSWITGHPSWKFERIIEETSEKYAISQRSTHIVA